MRAKASSLLHYTISRQGCDAGLGLGFIFIEVVFLQHFTLFLGQPIYTFAVVLAGLLMFTGLGAYLSDRQGGAPRARLSFVIPALLVWLTVTAWLTPMMFHARWPFRFLRGWHSRWR